jgi:alpha-beta hydrolase superfamily lysophospholipase
VRPDAATTLLAHSYGTLVSSKALQGGAEFDRVAFMGSPGLGRDVHRVADLGLPPETRVFGMRAPGTTSPTARGTARTR